MTIIFYNKLKIRQLVTQKPYLTTLSGMALYYTETFRKASFYL